MKATELRIGNYVEFDGEVIDLFLSQIGELLEDAESMKPIPLTEEWLFKFGFIKRTKKYSDWDNTILGICYDVDTNSYFIETYFDCSDKQNLKHVHQLQNLYFALTGEELTLKQKR